MNVAAAIIFFLFFLPFIGCLGYGVWKCFIGDEATSPPLHDEDKTIINHIDERLNE